VRVPTTSISPVYRNGGTRVALALCVSENLCSSTSTSAMFVEKSIELLNWALSHSPKRISKEFVQNAEKFQFDLDLKIQFLEIHILNSMIVMKLGEFFYQNYLS
jgi:hypothetical protein